MTSLLAAALSFVGIHVLISGTPLRARLVAALGEKAYLGVFSLLSAGVLAWLVIAFGRITQPAVTTLAEWRGVAAVLNLVALVFVVYGVIGKSPTALGGEASLHRPDPARAMHRITRHPMLWGFALWAATHLAYNPEPATAVFFGTFLALSVIGTFSIDAKRARTLGESWKRYAAVTSNIPFAAIAQKRNKLVWGEFLDWRTIAALVAFVALSGTHARLFGLPAF